MRNQPNEKIHLTPREYDVLIRLKEGRTNTQISEELFITERTVRAHVQHIMKKLKAKNRLEAVIAAIKLGLLRI